MCPLLLVTKSHPGVAISLLSEPRFVSVDVKLRGVTENLAKLEFVHQWGPASPPCPLHVGAFNVHVGCSGELVGMKALIVQEGDRDGRSSL